MKVRNEILSNLEACRMAVRLLELFASLVGLSPHYSDEDLERLSELMAEAKRQEYNETSVVALELRNAGFNFKQACAFLESEKASSGCIEVACGTAFESAES